MSPRGAARILVVDDNEANRALAKATLEDEGCTVIVATGGAEGIAAFAAEAPDCVLLDVRMPDIDGFAVCERMRALPGGPETPILFLTALRDVDTFDRALRAGGDDFLTKPVRPTELVVRVQTALELQRAKAALRDHYVLLKKQRDDLQRLQLQKERLTAFIVHDLKNPVNSMDLHAQILVRDKDLSASARESAAQIRTEARHLTRMILNLLDVSKADEGQLTPKKSRVDLEAVMQSVVAELEVTARTRGVELRTSLDGANAFADEDLLRRVLTNLTENAIRHSPSASTVRISATRTDGATELRIADAGPGIPADLHERIFDPFVQLDADERLNRTSRGLGLSFCRTAIEAHDGRIWIEDASPGSVFCLRLPDES
jgi:two-component system sensor histidine kinase/response regulator